MKMEEQRRVHRGAVILMLLIPFALIPFETGLLGFSVPGIKRLKISELLIPLLFGLTLLDLALNRKDLSFFFSHRGNVLGVFVFIFMFVLLLNYIRNPLLLSSLSSGEGGLRTYYGFFSGFLVYLILIYWVNRNQISVEQLLRILTCTVVAISLTGILVRFTGMDIPGLHGHHTWSVSEAAAYGSRRVPFLELFAQVGLFLALTGLVFGGKFRIPFTIFFFACIYIGGGRTGLISSIVGIIVLLFLNRRFLLTAAVLAGAVLAFASIALIQEATTDPQVKQLTNIGALKETSTRRYYLYKFGLRDFLNHPLIGVGYGRSPDIGVVKVRGKLISAEKYVNKQLRMGGHATHLAILRNMGLIGYLPFLLIWLYPAKKLLGVAFSPTRTWSREHKQYAQFVIVFISALLIRMLVEGNGSELRLYIYMGICAAVINEILHAKERLIAKLAETATQHTGAPTLL